VLFNVTFEQDTQCRYNVTLRRVRATISVAEKTISVPYSESAFAALGIRMQCACAIKSSVACSAKKYFFHIISYSARFSKKKKKKLLNKMCVLIFSTTLSATFLILRRIDRDMVKNVYWYSCEVSVIFHDFIETRIF